MKLSEIIAAYGDAEVEIQKLDVCMINFNRTKHGTKATFVTDQDWDMKGFKNFGMVLWFDRTKLDKVIKDLK